MIDVLKYISNPAELRLGNIVFHYRRGLTEWCSGNFTAFAHPMMNGNYGYHPIPLTEKVLEACGFEGQLHSDEWTYVKDENLFIIEYFGHTQAWHFTGGSGCRYGVGATHLHQLQNLYFAMAGTELQIDLEKLKEAVDKL